uniref:Uncharacterized protein TCIL3000_10_6240 n=1 Tax=Trypanosoma congolense (strain IL3000) TaxID=1068625 RepID=G0UWT4_TRYCI|nr:unnamed protein product [Trypanosoma congolense IL3000]
MISPMPFPTYPREAADVVLRGFYRLGAAAFIISFVVLTVEIRARLQASIPGGLRSTEPNLSEPLSMVMENCEYLGTMRVYGVYVNVGVNDKSLPSAIISMLQYAAAVLVVQFLAVVNSAIGVYLYAACVQNIYIVGLNIPAHLVVNVLAFVYCVTLISLVAMSSSFREYYSSSLDFCAEKPCHQR